MPKKKIYTVATSHLDTVWSWDFETTVSQYIYNTLVDNFKLFEKYPSYKFSFEGSYRYELMEEYYPELFDKMKDYIAKGRWNVCGSAFENGDTNIPSPEALFRKILLVNYYFDEKFGKRSVDIYLPDCFGFGWALPAIERHSNLMGFTTQKLAWGSAYGIPFEIGKWQGVDSSEVYASINPHDYYYTLTKLRDWDFVLNKFKVNEKQKVENGYKVTYQQIPNAMENDDYYTFVIQSEDKAGNISKKSIHFTVNRYGSVYHLSSYAKSINGTYVKDADKIVLEEINTDQLSDCNLKVVRDNDPIALKNEDASIEKKHDKWYKVTYTVNASALKEEGTYRIITSSKDTAKHTSSNDMSKKKASISFGVDTTKPNILISNIEGGKVYAQDGRTATVLVKDNLLLQSAKIYVNDNLIKEYDEKVPEKIDIPLDQKDEAQSIHVIVKDAAGNESEITMDNIYVTTNLWIRFIHSVPAMATAGGVSLAVILAAVIVLRKRIKAKPSVEDDEK